MERAAAVRQGTAAAVAAVASGGAAVGASILPAGLAASALGLAQPAVLAAGASIPAAVADTRPIDRCSISMQSANKRNCNHARSSLGS